MSTDLGIRLKDARKEHGWPLSEAARRSGVADAHISQLETGKIRQPGTRVLARLAAAYKIPLAELLTLAGYVSFGDLGEDGRLADYEGHELWHVVAYLPRGREEEVAGWMAAHGIEIYRMWKPEEIARRSR